MKPILTLIALVITSLSTSNTYAQSSGSHGGDPNEQAEFTGKGGQHLDSWFAVKQDLIQGLLQDRHKQLDLGKHDPDKFKADVSEALRTAKVEWDDKEIIVQGVHRPCENFRDAQAVRHIHCNQTTYAAAMKNYDAETQYKLEAHEYFAVAGEAGYEPNSYGESDYPISSQISVNLTSVTVKRWAVKFDLEKLKRQANQFMCYVPDLDLKFTRYNDENLSNFLEINQPGTATYETSLERQMSYEQYTGDYEFGGTIAKTYTENSIRHTERYRYDATISLDKYPLFSFGNECWGEWIDGTFKTAAIRKLGDHHYERGVEKTHKLYCVYSDESNDPLFPLWQLPWTTMVPYFPKRCVAHEPPVKESSEDDNEAWADGRNWESPRNVKPENFDPFKNFSEAVYRSDKTLFMNLSDRMIDQEIRERAKPKTPKKTQSLTDQAKGLTCTHDESGDHYSLKILKMASKTGSPSKLYSIQYAIDDKPLKPMVTTFADGKEVPFDCVFSPASLGVFDCHGKTSGNWKASYSGKIVAVDSGLAQLELLLDSNYIIFRSLKFNQNECHYNP